MYLYEHSRRLASRGETVIKWRKIRQKVRGEGGTEGAPGSRAGGTNVPAPPPRRAPPTPHPAACRRAPHPHPRRGAALILKASSTSQRPLAAQSPPPTTAPHLTSSPKPKAPAALREAPRSLGGDGGRRKEAEPCQWPRVISPLPAMLRCKWWPCWVPWGLRFLNSPPAPGDGGVERADGGGWHLWGSGVGVGGEGRRGEQTSQQDGGFHSGASPFLLFLLQRRRQLRQRRRQRQQEQATPLSKWRRLAWAVTSSGAGPSGGAGGGARRGAAGRPPGPAPSSPRGRLVPPSCAAPRPARWESSLFRRPGRAPLGPAPRAPSPRAEPDPGAAQRPR